MTDYIFNYNQYKKTITKNNNYFFLIISLVIILLLSICVILKPKNQNVTEFYFIEIGNFQTYENAINLSLEAQNKNGAGYIYFNNTYHVFVSTHTSKKDAEKVLNNIQNSYPNSNIFSLKKANKFQSKSITDFSEKSNKTILHLEHLSNQYFINKISYKTLNLQLNKCKQEFGDFANDILSTLNKNAKFNTHIEHLINMQNSLNFILDLNEEDFKKSFRYYQIKFIIDCNNFFALFD